MRRFFPGAVFIALGLTACSTPVVEGPLNQPEPVTLPSLGVSVINIPITLDLDLMREEALKRLPSPIATGSTTQVMRINFNPGDKDKKTAISCSVTSLNCLGNRVGSTIGRAVAIDYTAPVETQLNYQAYLRDLNMRVLGNQFTVTTQLEFSVATKIHSPLTQFGIASCGINEAMPKVEFTLPGSVNWGANGDLVLSPGKWTMKWLKPCNITAFQLNVEALMDLPLIRGKVEKAIDEAIAMNLRQVGLRAALQKAWPLLNAPQELQPEVWLMLNPEKVGFADISGNGRYLTSGVMVRARPAVVTGPKPQAKLPPVPAPERLPLSEGFQIALRGDLSLAKANELLNQQLAGKPLAANGRTVIIDKLRLYGSGKKAVIGLTLSQPIKGEIYALAVPVFDVAKNELRLTDVEYTLATSNLLAKSANWMLQGSLREALEKNAKFSFDEDLASGLKDFRNYRQELGSGFALRANIDRVRPQGLFFTQDAIKAFVVVDGKLWLDGLRSK